MGVYGILKDLFDFVNGFFFAHFVVGAELCLEVACGLSHAVPVPKVVTGQQAVYVLKKCLRRNGVLERKVGVQRSFVKAFFKIRVLQNAFYFAGIHKILADLRVVKGLYAEEITRKEQAVVLGVIDGEGKHAP